MFFKVVLPKSIDSDFTKNHNWLFPTLLVTSTAGGCCPLKLPHGNCTAGVSGRRPGAVKLKRDRRPNGWKSKGWSPKGENHPQSTRGCVVFLQFLGGLIWLEPYHQTVRCVVVVVVNPSALQEVSLLGEAVDGKPLYRRPVVRLHKSLYGHPEAGSHWQEHLEAELQKMGGKKIPEFDSTFLFRLCGLALIVYVDDFLLEGTASAVLRWIVSRNWRRQFEDGTETSNRLLFLHLSKSTGNPISKSKSFKTSNDQWAMVPRPTATMFAEFKMVSNIGWDKKCLAPKISCQRSCLQRKSGCPAKTNKFSRFWDTSRTNGFWHLWLRFCLFCLRCFWNQVVFVLVDLVFVRNRPLLKLWSHQLWLINIMVGSFSENEHQRN